MIGLYGVDSSTLWWCLKECIAELYRCKALPNVPDYIIESCAEDISTLSDYLMEIHYNG